MQLGPRVNASHAKVNPPGLNDEAAIGSTKEVRQQEFNKTKSDASGISFKRGRQTSQEESSEDEIAREVRELNREPKPKKMNKQREAPTGRDSAEELNGEHITEGHPAACPVRPSVDENPKYSADDETRAVASTLPSERVASPVKARPLGAPTPRRTNPLVQLYYARGSGGPELVSLRTDAPNRFNACSEFVSDANFETPYAAADGGGQRTSGVTPKLHETAALRAHRKMAARFLSNAKATS